MNDIYQALSLRKKPIPARLLDYGFCKTDAGFAYNTEILEGTFSLTIHIDTKGKIDSHLVELENGEAYTLYKSKATGSFVGLVRSSIEAVLLDIIEHCYENAVFQSRQAQVLLGFVHEEYGDSPEFLWPKFPSNAILRRRDNKKWYAALLTVAGKKIGLATDALVEIVDLRMVPEQAGEMLAKAHYYPGWHMNKKSWCTLVLDDSISDEELLERLQESYKLALK